MSQPDRFIDGIYNYCDRWCERCPLTARCRTFALERRLEEAGPDGDNAEFWAALGLHIPADGKHEDSDFDERPSWVEPGADEAWREARADDREPHPLAEAGMDYGTVAHHWLRRYGDEIERLAWPDSAVSPAEALQVARWYCLQIGVKLSRALSKRHDPDDEPWLSEDDGQADGDEIASAIAEAERADRAGSAKVALLGIERSLGAWTVLRHAMPDRDAEIVEFQRRLARLRRRIDEVVPEARTFLRPGFDGPAE